MRIPEKNDLLDVYFVLGTDLSPDAAAFYAGSHNHIMIQEPTWRQMTEGSVQRFREELDNDTEPNAWIEQLKHQPDKVLEAYLRYNFQMKLLHEIGHRLHYSLDPATQLELHNKFIQAAEMAPDFRDAVNNFTRALYQSGNYYDLHREEANHPVCRFEDAYWRETGIYDPRTFTFSKEGVPTQVALASFVTEALAFTSGRVLLANMLQNKRPFATELAELFATASGDALSDRIIAIRQLHAAITNSTFFTSTDLSHFFPDSVIDELFLSVDTHKNAASYVSEKIKSIEPT